MRRVVELGAATVEWGVFSLLIANNPDGAGAVDPAADGARGLRIAIAVRERHGNDAMGRFYFALGERYFERLDEYTELATFEGALADCGLDPALATEALADESTWATVVAEHTALVEQTKAFGVPTIRLDGGRGLAVFGPVVSEVPNDDDAVKLLEHVRWLAAYPNFAELKRERTVALDTARTRKWAEERAARKKAGG